MRQVLKRHPNSPCEALAAIEVEIDRPEPGRLRLTYRVRGRIADLRLPGAAAPARTDELWRHTCFEAFARAAGGEAYAEFNFSPSSEWAAYRFDDYRQGMRPADDAGDPGVSSRRSEEMLELSASVPIDPGAIRLGLSAVIEEADGRISYWALAHPPGKPDFHHADCFALEIPAPLAP